MKSNNIDILKGSKKKIDILVSMGAGEAIDRSLNKLIGFQIAKYKNNIDQIRHELDKFEKKFNMASEDFYKKFESGKLGDEGDFFEWCGLYENIILYTNRIKTLEAALKNDWELFE